MITLSKLWKPIYVGDGETIPRWYGCSRWIPYHLTQKEPQPSAGYWKWRRVYYPIPVNMALAMYYWIRWFLKVGYSLPPECYRNQCFEVKSHCPHCGKNVYDFPPS